jgi:methionyl-tRNA formyltransferase
MLQLEGQIVRVLQAQAMPDVKIENRAPGKVIFVEENFPVVVCGASLLILRDFRSESGKSMLPLPKLISKFQ